MDFIDFFSFSESKISCKRKNLIKIVFFVLTEITSTDKIGYTEVESVDYGFVPARIRRLGLMRFKPKAAKAEGTNRAELVSCTFIYIMSKYAKLLNNNFYI